MTTILATTPRTAVHIRLIGDVQGYGVRPTVACLANQHGLFGSVKNSLQGVDIIAVGAKEAIASFGRDIARHFPDVHQELSTETGPKPTTGFQILESESDGAVQTIIPRDRVVCDTCWRECQTPGNRRFGYPLIGCAQCGPRYSMMTAMPYDRRLTSMSGFGMCPDCMAEYHSPTDRRYHAQTNCCAVCGPRVWFEENGTTIEASDEAIEAASQAILRERMALKGLGGYQLICDARNPDVVKRLRTRKRRLSKPLAIMVESIDAAHELASINETEARVLGGTSGPIVLVRSLTQTCLAPNIHPGLKTLGVMLPTTAMHRMLLGKTRIPWVVTSGNIEGEPLEYCETEAVDRLSTIADCFLHHNRPIVHPIDDSVVCVVQDRTITVRAARGLAPVPIDCPTNASIVALGSFQKSAMAISNGRATFLGPHIGDLDTLRSRERFAEQRANSQSLMGCEAPNIVGDWHPDFPALHRAHAGSHLNSQFVQHHHAHVVSAMVEAGWMDRTVVGIALDGMGFGTDGTLWGGEVLLANRRSFQRLGRWRPFGLIGGDAAVREPWRIALSLLVDTLGEREALDFIDRTPFVAGKIERERIRNALRLLGRDSLSPITSSLGRLFDGVAALVCNIERIDFEGEAAMRLEATCDDTQNLGSVYPWSFVESELIEIDWRPMIRGVVDDLSLNEPIAAIAWKFHQTIADTIAAIGRRFPDWPMVLVGGVFQNRILVELVTSRLENQATTYTLPSRVPVNDGGLALGQLAIAAARSEEVCV